MTNCERAERVISVDKTDELVRLQEMAELTARQEAERVSQGLNWQRLTVKSSLPQECFDHDEPKPF